MKFLFTTNPLLGHFLPMVPLIRAVRAAGHEIRVASGADLAPAVHRHGFPLWAVGPTEEQVWAEARASADDARSEFERMRHDACVLFAEPGVARARQLMPMAAAWGPDVVVHELTEVAGWEAAAVSGAVDIVPGFGTPNRARAVLTAPYLDPCPPSLQPAGATPFTHVLPVRPEVGAVYPGERLPEAMRRLPHDRTIYLTLGTAFNAPEAWALALEAVRDLDVNVIATTGSDLDPEQLGPQPRHVALGPVRAPSAGATARRRGGLPRRLRHHPRCTRRGPPVGRPADGRGPVRQRRASRPHRGRAGRAARIAYAGGHPVRHHPGAEQPRLRPGRVRPAGRDRRDAVGRATGRGPGGVGGIDAAGTEDRVRCIRAAATESF